MVSVRPWKFPFDSVLAGNVFGTTRGAARTLCSWIVDCAGMSLAGDVAIVTGGGDGIGGATARRLAEEGASVLIVEVSELGEQNAAAIRAAGGVAEAVVLDVSKSEDVKAMVQTAVEKFGKVTILVNNACVQSRWPDWRRLMSSVTVCVVGLLSLSHAQVRCASRCSARWFSHRS